MRGATNRQIAEELGISAETVKRHLATVYDKCAVPGRLALVVHIMQSGMSLPRAS
jgi:DNA-binding CsgD family transcriptional regulator